MQYRQLGSSALRVSEISLGSWLTYGGGVERERAMACVHHAFDLGINFFDTANVYGRGAAESVLGEAFAGIPRDRYVLATKLFSSGLTKPLRRYQWLRPQLQRSLGVKVT